VFICSLLLFCGDAHVNPGHVRFPCGICKKSVTSSHRALLCDTCSCWYHIRCARVSPALYSHYLSLLDFAWHCPTCLFNLLPGEGVFIEHDELQQVQDISCIDIIPSTMETLESAPDGIQLIHHNVQGLLSKSTEIAH